MEILLKADGCATSSQELENNRLVVSGMLQCEVCVIDLFRVGKLCSLYLHRGQQMIQDFFQSVTGHGFNTSTVTWKRNVFGMS
jgi:hypothetical protein